MKTVLDCSEARNQIHVDNKKVHFIYSYICAPQKNNNKKKERQIKITHQIYAHCPVTWFANICVFLCGLVNEPPMPARDATRSILMNDLKGILYYEAKSLGLKK